MSQIPEGRITDRAGLPHGRPPVPAREGVTDRPVSQEQVIEVQSGWRRLPLHLGLLLGGGLLFLVGLATGETALGVLFLVLPGLLLGLCALALLCGHFTLQPN